VGFLQISNSFIFGVRKNQGYEPIADVVEVDNVEVDNVDVGIVGYSTDDDGRRICNLCLDVLSQEGREIRTFSCEHGLHEDCFQKMLHQAHPNVAMCCPICRVPHGVPLPPERAQDHVAQAIPGTVRIRQRINNVEDFDILKQRIMEHQENGDFIDLNLCLAISIWITKIPEDFFVGMDNLVSLDLSFNNLSSLPNSIGGLINLVSLDLSFNRLSFLPDSIGQLTRLELLDLSSNRLSSLPESIGSLINLRTLILRWNRLSSLPESIGSLINLRTLILRWNILTSLPNSIGELINLEHLNISDNKILRKPQLPDGVRLTFYPQFFRETMLVVGVAGLFL